MSEKSYRTALFSGKCPACREGDIFKYPITRLANFSDMHSHCPVCGANFEPEPGFYFGAMFISYAFNVALLTVFGLTIYRYTELSEFVYIVLIALLAILFTPFSFRASRVLWLYWFGGHHYKTRQKPQ
jgi:uncharacterized protein (DUF983 family)